MTHLTRAGVEKLDSILNALYYAQSDIAGTGLDPGTSRAARIRKAKKAILALITSQRQEAKRELLHDLVDTGEIHHSVFDYRIEALPTPHEQ